MFVVRRSHHNPILIPEHTHPWEGMATFNWCPVGVGDTTHFFYRAVSLPDPLQTPGSISIIGHAMSKDGYNFDSRERFIAPEEDWEKFGCEDPRVTEFEGEYYIFYTALSQYPFTPEGIKVGVAISRDLKKVDEKHLVTPFNSKAMALFPERVGGKITVIFSAHTDGGAARMAIAQFDKKENIWSPEFWEKWHNEIDNHTLNLRRNDYDQIEIGAPPVKTPYGWLLIYSHIQNYFGSPSGVGRIFGIEAALLDFNDPRKIIGRTKGPIIAPEEPYELIGHVQNVTFPSGALVDGETLNIYYSAADTTACVARVNLNDFISSIYPDTATSWHLRRNPLNPILSPNPKNAWEAKAVFNPAAIDLDGSVHLLYRALSNDNTSSIGYARSKDGLVIDERLSEPVYVPRENFEMKKMQNANSGCEDPRIMKIGETLYMCYTAFDGISPPRVAVSTISEKDFLEKKWNWSKPELITPQGIDDKDTCILTEKDNGKYVILHRIGTDICADYLGSLNFKEEKVHRCIKVLSPRPGMWDSEKVGITAPPIKTEAGWLLLYHGISREHHTYRVGVVLLDTKDPTVVLRRSTDPIFEPEAIYEKEGVVPNVVFPCGMVIREGTLFVYYGGADKVVGVATMDMEKLMNALK